MRTDQIILYRINRRKGITKGHVARQDSTGLREHIG
jgi:hypothetical protein